MAAVQPPAPKAFDIDPAFDWEKDGGLEFRKPAKHRATYVTGDIKTRDPHAAIPSFKAFNLVVTKVTVFPNAPPNARVSFFIPCDESHSLFQFFKAADHFWVGPVAEFFASQNINLSDAEFRSHYDASHGGVYLKFNAKFITDANSEPKLVSSVPFDGVTLHELAYNPNICPFEASIIFSPEYAFYYYKKPEKHAVHADRKQEKPGFGLDFEVTRVRFEGKAASKADVGFD